ncbi:MAG TPA: LuxR C-terminal-related transcriptional regulator, partial [Streptosporangiaceae bacterium]|nr:LuxR C-terminal-related transcriptional regulator [Streptosporangiaceae bacterium]
GKTMALALWVAAEPGPVAWVSLDDYDNQPGVFWAHIVAALRRSGVAVAGTLPAAARERAVDHTFLLRLASVLAGQDPPVTLIVDDLHLLTEPAALGELEFVLRNVGPGLRLVVSSRMDPLLPLHRYRLAGELTEIRAGDLVFSTGEAGQLLAQHASTLSADSLECLTRRTEGWAAGLRLAAISMDTHSDPDRFVTELITEDSALTGYLMEEVFDAAPPQVREVLLATSILEQVSAETAAELTGNEQAGATLLAVARANAFVQPIGRGWYRYHTLFAEVLRLKLRHECPDRLSALHRRAARWYERNGALTDAVRHATQAGDWPLAAGMVIDALAISEIIEPRGSQSLAAEFASMPHEGTWTRVEPYLVCAATALAAGQCESSATTLDAAEDMLERLPADQEAASRLAAAIIRLAAARRTGDLASAAAAAARAEAMAGTVPTDDLARHPEIRARLLSSRGAVELWSGHLDQAARILDSDAAAAAAPGGEHERAACLGRLALVEVLRGRLRQAAKLAAQATAALTAGEQQPPAHHLDPAALVALAWVHLERNELREAGSRLTQAHAALRASPDKLVSAVACLAAAMGGLAEGHPTVAAEIAGQARCGWSVPPWLEHRLTSVESRARAAAGDIRAALAVAERASRGSSPEAAVTLAHAWAAAGDHNKARHALAPALTAGGRAPERVRLQAWLADAQLSYHSGDHTRGRRSLASALRLGKREQLRLPFAMERTWLRPVLRRDPELTRAHQQLLGPGLTSPGLAPASQTTTAPATPVIVDQLSEREREVLRYASGMLNTAEIASEMYISINTVKSHLKSIYRKLAAGHRGEAVRRARKLGLI